MIGAVCCTGADALALLDIASGERLGTVEVGSDPVHALVRGGDVWVATMGERAVSIVADGGVRRVDTGVLGPSHFAAAAGALFVPCTGGDATAVIDSDALEFVGRVHTGVEPHEAAVYDGDVYVGSRTDGTVTVVDAERAAAGAADPTVATIDLPTPTGDSARVQGVEAGADGVFAVDQRGARAYKVAPEDGVVAAADVGEDPSEVTVTPDRVFVPGRASATVHEFDHGLDPVGRHDVGERPVDVVALDHPWVVHRDATRLESLAGSAVIELPYPAIGAVPAGDELLVSHYDDAAVSLVDLASNGIRWTTETGANPFGAVVV